MSRIDVEMLTKAFEKRINALNQNPIEVVPDNVINAMLEKAIEDEIKNHFTYTIKRDLHKKLKVKFNEAKSRMVDIIAQDIISDSHFREIVTKRIKSSIIDNIK